MSEDSAGIRAAALALMAQYGDDAEIIATLRAAEFAAVGDLEGLRVWDAVIDFLAAVDEAGPERGALN